MPVFRRVVFSALGVGLAFAVMVVSAAAQTRFSTNEIGPSIHGIPPSVTSFGFGGSPGFHGSPPSVTSLNFGTTSFQVRPGTIGFGHRHRNAVFVSPFYGSVGYAPYAYPVYVMEPGPDDSMEEEDYRGGPTIFDRRGPGMREYARPEPRREGPELKPEEEDYRVSSRSEMSPPEVTEQPSTVLIFKDGHQQEISNYAIVGPTLYELNDGRARKVALSELDLVATVKQNDSRGVGFELPSSQVGR